MSGGGDWRLLLLWLYLLSRLVMRLVTVKYVARFGDLTLNRPIRLGMLRLCVSLTTKLCVVRFGFRSPGWTLVQLGCKVFLGRFG